VERTSNLSVDLLLKENLHKLPSLFREEISLPNLFRPSNRDKVKEDQLGDSDILCQVSSIRYLVQSILALNVAIPGIIPRLTEFFRAFTAWSHASGSSLNSSSFFGLAEFADTSVYFRHRSLATLRFSGFK
jgi:hypothetical protein